MTRPAHSPPEAGEAEARLREGLAAADAALANLGPVLERLLGPGDPALFSDRIVAQARAQLEDLAHQLAGPGAAAAELADALVTVPALLGHAHALALEAELVERLAAAIGLDPVNPPLVQALIEGPDADASATAMALLAAQARFLQSHRRGELPLAELPRALRGAALELHSRRGGEDAPAAQPGALADRASRLELLDRVTAGLGTAAFEIERAGVGLFVSALARAAGLDRGAAVLATTAGQGPRLALALIAAGAAAETVERQLLVLHPELALPEGIDTIAPARAAALLAAGR